MISGWECVYCRILIGSVSLLYHFEWSILELQWDDRDSRTGLTQLRAGLQEISQSCSTVEEGDGEDTEGNNFSCSHWSLSTQKRTRNSLLPLTSSGLVARLRQASENHGPQKLPADTLDC